MKNIIGIDSTYLSDESLFLFVDRLKTEVKHLKSNRITCYKNLEELDLNKECTIMEMFNALPNDCYAQLELNRENINLSTKFFKKNESVAPALLSVIKSNLRACFTLITEKGTLQRYIYGSAKNDSGWVGINSPFAIYVDVGDVGSINDFNHAGRYYLSRTISSNMNDFPTKWDCFLDIVRYRDSHFKYIVTNITAESEEWVKVISPTASSNWIKR